MRLVAIASLLFILAGPAPAQKARPVRIEFSGGSATSVVQGHLRGRQQMDYVARAQDKQKLILKLEEAPSGTLLVKVRDPEAKEIPLQSSTPRKWTAMLSQTGDYEISVLRVGEKPGVSRYKLTVTIR
jgi:hypothetical protein